MFQLKNSKGETISFGEVGQPNEKPFRLSNGKLISEDEFRSYIHTKYNGKTRGYELQNANGDIATSSLAYQYATDRLTYIRQKYVDQTFYELPPADYMDVIVGEGAFAADIVTNLSIKTAGSFSQGKLNVSGHNSRLNVADAAIAPVHTRVRNWALACEFSIFDVQQSAFSGNWDIVEARHRARKKEWDLGIQGIAFIGDPDDETYFPGLYTQPAVNSNTAVITKTISSMTAAEYATFVGALIAAYQSNCAYTAWPDTFLIPQDDYVGLAAPISSTYPTISKLEWLQRSFDAIVPGKKVKIAPCAYGMAAYNKKGGVNSGTGYARYVLYKKDIDTAFLEIPVDFQTTQAGTYNNFNFQDVAYGQFCGLTVLKQLEMLYFDF